MIPTGFEPVTHRLEICCSIQLSYGTVGVSIIFKSGANVEIYLKYYKLGLRFFIISILLGLTYILLNINRFPILCLMLKIPVIYPITVFISAVKVSSYLLSLQWRPSTLIINTILPIFQLCVWTINTYNTPGWKDSEFVKIKS